ncbi:MAG: class I SAM-dependent methyltransferase, partial [Pseudomonadota bacterium]
AEWEALRRRHIAEEALEAAMLDLVDRKIDQFVDLGTGTGRMLVVFQDLYQKGVGYDVSPEMLSIARAKLSEAGVAHAHVRRGDFLKDPLQTDIDLICFHHVLHFLGEPDRAIATAAARLSPTGCMLIADFAPHTHEDLRDHHAHRRLGFRDEEIERWATRAHLSVSADCRLDPPEEGGLVTRIWRLEPLPSTALRINHPLPQRTDHYVSS